MRLSFLKSTLVIAFSISTLVAAAHHRHLSDNKDKVLYSFVATGCNRVDKDDVNDNNPSTANIAQLTKTFEDVAALEPQPDFFFFTGDLIMGYQADTAILGKELRAWKAIYYQSTLSKTKVKLIVLPGNHELKESKKKPAFAAAEQCWINNMNEFLPYHNGPMAGGDDKLPTDESRLTASFNYKGSHFILCNTDGVGMESKVPIHWIAKDIATAKKDNPIFVFSHQPAVSYNGEKGIDTANGLNHAFWALLEQYHTTAMISAHNHVYFTAQPHAGSTWQIVAGNGGSKLEKEVTAPEAQFYGFVQIKVYHHKKVEMNMYGRNFDPANYLAPPTSPTTIRETKVLSAGN